MIEQYNPQTRTYIVYDPDLVKADPDHLFDVSAAKESTSAIGPSESVVFVSCGDRKLARKHYRRRGQMARFIDDRYGWLPLAHTRVWREFHLLHRLWKQGLPVPRPVAARCCYGGRIFYTADLVTLRIVDAINLRDCLHEQVLQASMWWEIGRLIQRFHLENVCHADLNASNILIESGKSIHLIDFDKCQVKLKPGPWKTANLQKLQRSLLKSKAQSANFHFEEEDWQALMSGYRSML